MYYVIYYIYYVRYYVSHIMFLFTKTDSFEYFLGLLCYSVIEPGKSK